jgi:hypothetical protein
MEPKLVDLESIPPPSRPVTVLAPSSPVSKVMSPTEERLDLCDECLDLKNFDLRRDVPKFVVEAVDETLLRTIPEDLIADVNVVLVVVDPSKTVRVP